MATKHFYIGLGIVALLCAIGFAATNYQIRQLRKEEEPCNCHEESKPQASSN